MKRISLYLVAILALAFIVGGAGAGSASATVGQQLLVNPGAESGSTSPDGWSLGAWGTGLTASLTWSDDHHATGSHSLKAEITAYGTEGDAKWWPQQVPVTGGTYYALSDWYKSNIPSAVSVEYWMSGDNLNTDGHWVNLYSDIAASPDTWTQYQTGFTMPSGAVKAIFVHLIAGVGWLETDDYAMTEQAAPAGFSSPTISLTFDDGSNTFYNGTNGSSGDSDTAYYMLSHKYSPNGYKATTYIPTSMIGETDYMTSDQIAFIAGKGYEIGSHSVSHGDLTTISDDVALASEFTGSKSRLEGIAPAVGSVTDFAYPFGNYNAHVIDKAQAAGYVSGRSVEAGYNSKADVQAYDIRVQNMTPDVTLDQFKSWVNYAKDHNYWLVVVYHRVVPSPRYGSLPRCPVSGTADCLNPYDVSSNDLQSQLDYISSAHLDANVKTVKQALLALASQTPPSTGTVKLTPSNPTITDTVTAAPIGFYSLGYAALQYTYGWKVNGAPVSGATGQTLDLSHVLNGKRGDTITAEVYAKDQGNALTSTTASTTATVANSAPVKGSVGLAPQSPKAGDVLTATASGFTDIDGDSLTDQYMWYLNGTVVPGATSATFPLTTAVGGDIVKVEVRDGDGHGGVSDPATASVTLANTDPVKGSVTIAPDPPQVGSMLTATPTGFTDVDNANDPKHDTLVYHYQWAVNGTAVQDATEQSYKLTSAARGDTVTVTVSAEDGHGGTSAAAERSVTLVNTPPVKGTVAITPVAPKVGETVTANPSGFADADHDELTYSYQWSINGTVITGATGRTFALTTAVRTNLIAVAVSATDGHLGTTEIVSTYVMVDNSPPIPGSVTITPSSAKAKAVLTAIPSGFTDIDGDTSFNYHYQWSVNGDAVPGAITSKYTLTTAVRGNEVTVDVTADDGRQVVGAPATASLTVADTAPVVGSVAISPSSPKAGTSLTATPGGFADVDGDPLVYTYQWTINGVPAGTGSTLVNPTTVHDDVVKVTVSADDGHGGTSDSASANVTLTNTPPVLGSVSISPSSPGIGETLTATPAGYVDADGDAPVYTYEWTINGHAVPGVTGSTLEKPPTVRDDEVSVTVSAADGHGDTTTSVSKPVVVGNVAPLKGTVSISPSSPMTDATLTATHTAFVDPDGDAPTYSYQWSVNGSPVDGATSETFDLSQAGHGDHGDAVTVTVSADDGHTGVTDVSSSVTVVDSAPVKGSVAITPSSPTAGTALTATPTGFTDPDGDTLSYSYQWSLNGTTIAGQTSATLPGSAVPAGQIGVQVTATDKPGASSEAASATITVSAPPAIDTTAPTILIASPAAKAYRLGQKLPVSYSCTDPAGIASCTATLARVGSSPGNVTSGQNVTPATAGHYLLSITAKDRAGNSNTATVAFTVTDTAAPTILITSPKAKTYRIGQKLQIKYFCTDISGIASYTATLARDRTKPGKISSGKTIRLTKTGRYTLKITATDHNGNTTTKTLKFNAKP